MSVAKRMMFDEWKREAKQCIECEKDNAPAHQCSVCGGSYSACVEHDSGRCGFDCKQEEEEDHEAAAWQEEEDQIEEDRVSCYQL